MRDCRKYHDLTLLGLDLLRFAWEHVVVEQTCTKAVLQDAGRQGCAAWVSAEQTHASAVA